MIDNQLPDVTKRAVTQIVRLMEKLPSKIEKSEYLPSVSWRVRSSDESDVMPGPLIGIHRKDKVPSEFIKESHGIKIAYNLPEQILARHRDSILDYLNGHFLFVDKASIQFLGNENGS